MLSPPIGSEDRSPSAGRLNGQLPGSWATVEAQHPTLEQGGRGRHSAVHPPCSALPDSSVLLLLLLLLLLILLLLLLLLLQKHPAKIT